jgi:hypothetical protein
MLLLLSSAAAARGGAAALAATLRAPTPLAIATLYANYLRQIVEDLIAGVHDAAAAVLCYHYSTTSTADIARTTSQE